MKLMAVLFGILWGGVWMPVAAAEPSPAQEVGERVSGSDPQPTPSEDQMRVGIGFHYNTSAYSRFEHGRVSMSGGSTAVRADVGHDPAYGIQVSLQKTFRDGWGFSGSFRMEQGRKLNDWTLDDGSGAVSQSMEYKPELKMTILEANLVYRWKDLYLPFGLNFSSVQFGAAAGDPIYYDVKGGLGTQVGLGYFVQENFAFEASLEVIGLQASMKSGGTKIDLGQGYMTGLGLTFKYLFGK